MCSQPNVRASAEDNTDKGHTPNPRTETKIPDPAETRTRAAGLEDRDSTDHATATDTYRAYSIKIINLWQLIWKFKIQKHSVPVSIKVDSKPGC